MRRRSSTGGKPLNAGRQKASASTRPSAPKTARPHKSPAADEETEVARLRRELNEALEQQAATSEVLKVISRSTFDLPAVLDTLTESACRLCEADIGTIRFEDGDRYRLAATYGCSPEWHSHFAGYSGKPDKTSVFGQTITKGRTVHIPDVLEDPDYARPQAQKLMGLRAALGVPLVRNGRVFGVVNLFRTAPTAFTQKQIELADTFANQAVIAIENARLLNELRQRTGDLSEALEHQTATSEVLNVISNSLSDTRPVFEAIVRSGLKLFGDVAVVILIPHGDKAVAEAIADADPTRAEALWQRLPIPLTREFMGSRAIIDGKIVDVPDVDNPPADLAPGAKNFRASGYRAVTIVPMMRSGSAIGSLMIARVVPGPLSGKQIELLQSFAAQAVIAIENTRLLSELRETLERQTATSDVLQVISSSPGEVDAVFNSILDNAVRICGARFGNLALFDGTDMRVAAMHNAPAEFERQRRENPIVPTENSTLGVVVRTKKKLHIVDLYAEPAYANSPLVKDAHARSMLAVPMIKEDQLVGAINIYRQEVRPFSDKQIELLQNFAAQAVIAIENARLLNELRERTDDLTESLEQQTATSDVLSVMSRSKFDLAPILQSVVDTAARLCRAEKAVIFRLHDGVYRFEAGYSLDPEYIEIEKATLIVPGPGTAVGRAAMQRQVIRIDDALVDPDYAAKEDAKVGDVRSMIGVPLMREGEPIGVIALARSRVEPFNEREIELVTTFADQAVIAIENVRLFDEVQARTDDLTESLEQQTATSEVLQVISSSPGELEPVFDAMLANATRICEAKFGTLFLRDGDTFHLAAMNGVAPDIAEELLRIGPRRPGPNTVLGRIVDTNLTVHIADVAAEAAYFDTPAGFTGPTLTQKAGARTLVGVPMLKENELIGAIIIYRQEARPFAEKQIALLTSFAAQAVIAVENTRLLKELRQRTDDLTESLEQQTATSEVLQVISSSPGELDPVFRAMLENATRVCEAKFGILFRYDSGLFHPAAMLDVPAAFSEFLTKQGAFAPKPGQLFGRLCESKTVVHVIDRAAEEDVSPSARLGGARSSIAVPMLKEGELVGAFFIYRTEVTPFTDKQIELVQNFAAQAVIAIENTRLLSELRESLQQQTATADVLKVISRSAFDLETVLNTLLEVSGTPVRGAYFLDLPTRRRHSAVDGELRPHPRGARADQGLFPAVGGARRPRQHRRARRIRGGRGAYSRRARRPRIHMGRGAESAVIAPASARRCCGREKSSASSSSQRPFRNRYREANRAAQDLCRPGRDRHREHAAAQRIAPAHRGPRESLAQQTATADVLKVISRSTFDLQTVLDTLVELAARLCEAESAAIHRPVGDAYPFIASHGYSEKYAEYMRTHPIKPSLGSVLGRAVLQGQIVHVADVEADPDYALTEARKIGGFRTVLGVPLMRERTPIGIIMLTRSEMRPFTDKQVELVTTFADQAAIAIENVRLFESVEARTRELGKSLEDLRTAQDRLVQTEKLASLGQLTAGIAHEIKNPLNFVNNFSAISVELIDELREALAGANLDKKLRAEIGEIADMLQGNLDKVVQHGKRADSIVKNMLLHSRQGSGEHRPVEINALVEESLNLAYHGARAEKQGFNITLEKSFDPAAGEVDLFPQEITRVLLNLISNGFYAATKRKAEGNGGDYEPTLAAATRNLGDSVEIRIRDNGTGIPLEVKEKMFNPFFTTKPVGEGTGLGLSISHDIVVKQHGGAIEVATEPGQFTEFTIILPRTAATIAKSGERP